MGFGGFVPLSCVLLNANFRSLLLLWPGNTFVLIRRGPWDKTPNTSANHGDCAMLGRLA